MTKKNYRRGAGATLATPSTLEAQEAARRRAIRAMKTDADMLPAQINALYNYVLRQLPKAFEDNKIAMQAWIELPDVYPLDIIEGLKKKFEQPGNDWKVAYEYRDWGTTFDHMGFTPPSDWMTRLLKA